MYWGSWGSGSILRRRRVICTSMARSEFSVSSPPPRPRSSIRSARLTGSPLLAAVSHYPQGDWRIGAPFYLCAAIQAIAAVIGLRYFSRAFHEAPARTVRTGA